MRHSARPNGTNEIVNVAGNDTDDYLNRSGNRMRFPQFGVQAFNGKSRPTVEVVPHLSCALDALGNVRRHCLKAAVALFVATVGGCVWLTAQRNRRIGR
jgi:hypothetical protein